MKDFLGPHNNEGKFSSLEHRTPLETSDIMEPSPELSRRDFLPYSCLANSSEIQKTEDFLKSKIQKGTGLYQLDYGNGEIIGRYFKDVDSTLYAI
jgi:hypothetical protein